MDTRALAKEAQSRSRCHSPGSDSLRSSLTETPRSTKKHKGHPLGWGGNNVVREIEFDGIASHRVDNGFLRSPLPWDVSIIHVQFRLCG